MNNISLENYRNKSFVNFCNNELEKYTQNYRGIETALLATPDGFEIAAFTNKNAYSEDKLAAVGSSLFALGSSLMGEFQLKDCKSIILDSEKGKVFISSIRSMQHSVILMIQTNEQETLGNIIHGARGLTEKIADNLRRLP